jgi:hypothetical protein
VSTPLPEGQQGAKAEALTDKIQAASILGFYRRFLLALEEITIISGTKKQLSSSRGGTRKYFIHANDRRYCL